MVQPHYESSTMKPPHKRYRVDLPKHLSACEVNYWRLRRLLPRLMSAEVDMRWPFIVGNNVSNESHISFKVIEQTKYTSLVHIVQYSQLQNISTCVKYSTGKVVEQRRTRQMLQSLYQRTQHNDRYTANVRLYHDAEMAEVVQCQHYRQFNSRYEYPNKEMHQVDEKARINQFFGELLAHCLLHARVTDTIASTIYVYKAH